MPYPVGCADRGERIYTALTRWLEDD